MHYVNKFSTAQGQCHSCSCSIECVAFELVEQLAVASLQKFEQFHDDLYSMFVPSSKEHKGA